MVFRFSTKPALGPLSTVLVGGSAIARSLNLSIPRTSALFELSNNRMPLPLRRADIIFSLSFSSVVSHKGSKKVEQLALTLINDKQNIVSSIHMLMVNYKKKYKELLADVYKKVRFTFYGYNPLIFYTIDFMRTKKLDLPNEILFSAYEKSFDAFSREYIVEIMKKRNLLTKEHINELKYDSNYEIRKKAIKWLKSI